MCHLAETFTETLISVRACMRCHCEVIRELMRQSIKRGAAFVVSSESKI